MICIKFHNSESYVLAIGDSKAFMECKHFFHPTSFQKKNLIRWLICGGSGDQITVLDIVDIITSKGVGWG